jgi:sucrose-6-phosphate hydrolase SacC (GH32 family)
MVVGRIEGIQRRPAGTEVYSSNNLIDWTYESTYRSCGEGWECPDLFRLPVDDRSRRDGYLRCRQWKLAQSNTT